MTRTQALVDDIRARIANGSLSTGSRLPSIRRYATTMKVSPSTVVEAYARLEATGIIRAQLGSGFYVTGAGVVPLALRERAPDRPRNIDPFWVSRQSLNADPQTLMPGCGWLPAAWLPTTAIRKGLRSVSRASEAILGDYGTTHGSLTLRRLLLNRFADEGLSANLDQIMLTGSGTQAIDLICRLLLRQGDIVLVDDPCYFNFQALLRAHQVKIRGIPMTPNGPDIAAFEQALKEDKPRLYITNSALHNPTGASLSPPIAHRVLSLATTHGLTIVEDDIFVDFEPSPSPRLAILDGLNRVIRIGSFTKTLSASLRCGYIATPPDWIENLIDLQLATSFAGASPVAAELIAHILTGGSYRKHMVDIRQRLHQAQKRTIDKLAALDIVPWLVPRGGFYLWCRLPEGHDAAHIAQQCLSEKILLAPGNIFSTTQSAPSFLRFNTTQLSNPRIFLSLKKALSNSP